MRKERERREDSQSEDRNGEEFEWSAFDFMRLILLVFD